MAEAKSRGMDVEPPKHVEIIGCDIKILESRIQTAALNQTEFFLLVQTDQEQIHCIIIFFIFNQTFF